MDATSGSDSDDSSLFEPSSPQPDKKRRKLNNNQTDNAETEEKNSGLDTAEASTENNHQETSKKTVDPVLLAHAKSRLSKFAARLFDPNRIKGLVEAPETIPLNDEFLKAFGKREKEMDKLRGREEEIEHRIDDVEEEDEEKNSTTEKKKSKKKKNGASIQKVKVNNLAYRTSQETLFNACLQFGNVVEVNMVLEGATKQNSNNHNSGRAYVTFETEEGAQACIKGLKSLDGRQLRCALALARPQKNSSRRASASLLNNQTMKDITTICFRCGQVGHMESDCPNPAKPKPCCLCGSTDHDFRACPNKQICFNCGQPGHISRDCTFRRGMPRRMVCGTCFQTGHHRLQCRTQTLPTYIPEAICMDCGKRGHFMCNKPKWFYGLRGMSCFNCGAQGHSGYDCDRPTLYQCIQDPNLAVQEIERAEANSIAEELERERRQQRERENQRNRGRKNNRGYGDAKKRRAKSSGPGRRDWRGY